MTKVLATDGAEHNSAIFPFVIEPNVNYVFASCRQLETNHAITSTGQTIEFDVCVIATGINYHTFQAGPDHPTMQDRKKFILEMQSKISAANTIVIGGGGPLGTEIASDIKIRNPSKKYVIT